MSEKPERGEAENSLLAMHRRQMDALTHPAWKNPRFNQARKDVVDVLEGRKTDISPAAEPIELKATNTDVRGLYIKKES